MNTNLSLAVLTANLIGLLLIGTLFFGNRQRMNHDRDMHSTLQMMAITAVSNAAECCVFYLAGNTGTIVKILVFLSGSWLFLANVLIGYAWAKFIMTHMNIPFSDRRKKIYQGIRLTACVLLVFNIFCPIVFRNQNGIYQRGPAYSVFLLFAAFYIIDSLYLYARCRKRVGTLKLFPVQVFLAPVVIGLVVQALFMEVAITWPSIAIAIAGIMTALRNELILVDRLTGLYNRVYLEFLQKQADHKKSAWIAGVMIDLNDFKNINDNYGHSEGDAALIMAADILRKSFGEYGVVTRYAGDEFVVILNTIDEPFIQELIKRTKQNFEEANNTNGKPYRLSASMGYSVADLSKESIDDFMNQIDSRMYKDKLEYYRNNAHDRRNR